VAFVFGLCLGRILKGPQDPLSLADAISSGALLAFALFRTGRTNSRSASGETGRKRAREFLWSSISFSVLTLTFGIFASGLIWYLRDFIGTFGTVWLGALTRVAVFRAVTQSALPAANPAVLLRIK
jgi:hypothetical protein